MKQNKKLVAVSYQCACEAQLGGYYEDCADEHGYCPLNGDPRIITEHYDNGTFRRSVEGENYD